MKNDSSNVLTSLLCEENDPECHSFKEKLVQEHFVNAESEPEEMYYPDNFDPELMNYMEKVESTLQELTMENVDEVLKDLEKFKKEIEEMDDVSADDKDVALIGIHVAFQSVQMWHKTYSDPAHPLYGVHDSSHYFNVDNKIRELKDIDVATITMSDFQAGFNKVARMLSGEDGGLKGIGNALIAGAEGFLSMTSRCYGYYNHNGYHYSYYYHHHHHHSSTTSSNHTHPHNYFYEDHYDYYY